MHIKQTHISTARPNLLKEHVSPTHGLMNRIKHENTTRYIKHLAESANIKGGTFNKHCNGLIGNRFEMPNVSYTHPLITINTHKLFPQNLPFLKAFLSKKIFKKIIFRVRNSLCYIKILININPL